MHEYYKDIINKIAEEPQWFDEFAVPRYCEFGPRRLADIYANVCALVLIACQSCGEQFKVAFSQNAMDKVRYKLMFPDKELPSLAAQIKAKTIHYGDPPNIECCPAGPTETCINIKVLQYWKRDKFEWVRDKSLEIEIEEEELTE